MLLVLGKKAVWYRQDLIIEACVVLKTFFKVIINLILSSWCFWSLFCAQKSDCSVDIQNNMRVCLEQK